MTFDKFNFHPSIAQGIAQQGFTAPTPIQEQALPVVLDNSDVLGIAQTGTGKTAAFVLPILQRLITGKKGGVRALIVTPTRELAVQIEQVICELGQHTDLRSATIFGGVNINQQIKKLRKGVDIVVACPGRLLDHVQRKTISLSNVEVLVLDEADQMFDMGFLPDIRRIVKYLPENRQSLLFSATMPPQIRSLAVKILKNPVSVDVGKQAPLSTIEHAIYPVAHNLKNELLMALFEQMEVSSVIVFTRTKHRAKRLAEKLSRAGHATTSLQGNLSQARRQEAMAGFKKGKYHVLVATDIAARGIDISTVSHVINYDMPSTAEAYTHRIGRTGRAARSGDAYTLYTSEDRKMLSSIERVLGGPLERRQVTGFKYDAVPEKDSGERQSRNFRGGRSRRRYGRSDSGAGQGSGRGQKRVSNNRRRERA
jgi:ATP-dependent RNA helicase RhlE